MPGMKIGDFFKSAVHCKPVNPRPIEFVAIATGPTLPGGTRNPNPEQFCKARVTGAFVFLPPQDRDEVRAVAVECVDRRVEEKNTVAVEAAERAKQAKPKPRLPDDVAIGMQYTYECLARVLREWDPEQKTCGAPLFSDGDAMRQFVIWEEAQRMMNEYDKYIAEEHAEVVSDVNFRGAEKRGARVAAAAPRGSMAPAPVNS